MLVDTIALEKGLRAEFSRAYGAMIGGDVYAKLFAAVATVVPSGANNEKYGWFGDVPVVKEWIGDKTAGNLEDYDYTITNKNWYSMIGIDRNEIADDQIGAILPRIQMLAQRVRSYQGKLIANLLINGTTGTAYDSSAFFANRSSPNDNLLTGTGITNALLKADIYAARAAMMKFQSDTAEVMGLEMDTIVCPPELEGPVMEVVTSSNDPSLTGNANANPVKNWIKNVLVLPNATDANDWYGLATGFPIKPFVYQDREPVQTVLDDTAVKRNRTLEFSAEMRGNAGYAFFQMAIKTTNT